MLKPNFKANNIFREHTSAKKRKAWVYKIPKLISIAALTHIK